MDERIVPGQADLRKGAGGQEVVRDMHRRRLAVLREIDARQIGVRQIAEAIDRIGVAAHARLEFVFAADPVVEGPVPFAAQRQAPGVGADSRGRC